MDTSGEAPTTRSSGNRSIIVRVSVLGVVLAGAIALGSAAAMAGATAGATAGTLALLAMLVAIASGATWLYAPRVGFWLLLVDALGVLVLSGVGLATGPVPWMLVAFWGGSAVLLAALLHLISDSSPGRSTTATLVAVISLLVLSAVGLTAYVQATWPRAERATLQRISALAAPSPAEGAAWVVRPSPEAWGGWHCVWLYYGTPAEAWTGVRSALEQDGWLLGTLSTRTFVAGRGAEQITVSLNDVSAGVPTSSATVDRASVRLSATVRKVSAATYH
jgi:hypothetical protein